jgi:predicted nucleotidyltransferase
VAEPKNKRQGCARSLPRDFYVRRDAGNIDRPYNSEIGLLEQVNYDLELAGAALAGRDGRQLSGPATLAKLRTLLTADFMEALAERIRVSRWLLEPEQLSRVRAMLLTFRTNLLDQGSLRGLAG